MYFVWGDHTTKKNAQFGSKSSQKFACGLENWLKMVFIEIWENLEKQYVDQKKVDEIPLSKSRLLQNPNFVSVTSHLFYSLLYPAEFRHGNLFYHLKCMRAHKSTISIQFVILKDNDFWNGFQNQLKN